MAQIVVLKRAHFFSIDNDLIDVHAPTIGAIGVAIYTTLARYANRHTGQCWPAIGRLAQTLQLARSTVKVYLRKLEAAGLIAMRERQDTAGDPTSNLYTLLDPSPAAVDRRRTAQPVPEGGRPSADPPPVACRPTGGPPADPKPSSHEQKETNQPKGARAAEEPPDTRPANPCPHPLDERSYFGELAVCQHCWAMLDTQTATTLGDPQLGEESQTQAA